MEDKVQQDSVVRGEKGRLGQEQKNGQVGKEKVTKGDDIKEMKTTEKKRAYKKKYRQKHSEKMRAYGKKWYQEHKEEMRAYDKKYQQEHKEEKRAYNRKYHQEHKEEILARGKKYQQEHKEKISARRRKYYQEHKDEALAYQQEHKEKIYARNRKYRQQRHEEWLRYLPKNPKCQICHQHLKYFAKKNGKNFVCFDHKTGNEPIKYPAKWLVGHPPTPKNIKIWESCKFGILCHPCNRYLCLKNRIKWLKGAAQYAGLIVSEKKGVR